MVAKNNLKPIDAPVTIQNEEALIEQSQENPKAFKKLYERYFSMIFNFVLNRVNDKEITADITQQIFLNALTNIKRYENRGLPFSAYLYRIAINECNGYFRANKTTRFVVLDDSFSNMVMDEIGVDDDYDKQISQLKNVFERLKTDDVQLLELRFYEKYSFKEVGQLLSITENLAKVKTYRLLSRIKKMMGR